MSMQGMYKFYKARVDIKGKELLLDESQINTLIENDLDRHMANQLVSWRMDVNENGTIYLGMLKSTISEENLESAKSDGSIITDDYVYSPVNTWTEENGELFVPDPEDESEKMQITENGIIDMGDALFIKE